MKHILPILTLTTLTAAAFADAGAAAPAAASGLSYNRVGISRSGQDTNLSASTFLGSSNILASVETVSLGGIINPAVLNGSITLMSFGYVFKNVAAGVDATLTVGTANYAVGSIVGVNLRRALNEVVSGLEVAIGYKMQEVDADVNGSEVKLTSLTYEVAYNINKQYSVAYSLTDFGSDYNYLDQTHTVTVRYNF
jgi:hypothetical protein